MTAITDIRNELGSIVTGEFAESFTIDGVAKSGIVLAAYQAAQFGDNEIGSMRRSIRMKSSDFSGAVGSAVVYNSKSYTVQFIQPDEQTGLTVLLLRLV